MLGVLLPALEPVMGQVVVLTALLGELPLTLWLLVKGVDVDRWWARADEAAR